jgi:hypothetical protein
MPMRSPRAIRSEKSRTTGGPPQDFVTPIASMTSFPLSSASVVVIVTIPAARLASRRSRRSAERLAMRRTLRLRRAVTP